MSQNIQYYRSSCDFHAVGQGLFASGGVGVETAGRGVRPQLRWVYDCGTHSAAPALDDALARYRRWPGTRIDLLTLSHFDKDHVNGVARLIAGHSVGVLLLPYLSLAQRVATALAHGVGPADPMMAFYTNPVGFLSGGEARIGEVVFVPPSNSEGPRPETPEEPPPPTDAPEDRPPLSYETQEADDEQRRDMDAMRTRGGPVVRMLRAGGSLRFKDFWEFVPYNDARYASLADAAFIDAAGRAAESLLNAPNSAQAQEELDSLKAIYDLRFGERRRNEISLFLYGGPIHGFHQRISLYRRVTRETDGRGTRWQNVESHEDDSRHSILFTGDGTLDTPGRLKHMLDYLSTVRIGKLWIVQVMHHGSRYNWHDGVARALAPDVSMFCADPAHHGFGHPHGEVVRDFLPYGPALTDRTRAWGFDCYARVP